MNQTLLWDALGRRTQVAADLTTGGVTSHDYQNTYQHDALGRMTQVVQASQGAGAGFAPVLGKQVDFSYNARGQATEIVRSRFEGATPVADVTSSFGYDAAGRLASLAHVQEAGVYL